MLVVRSYAAAPSVWGNIVSFWLQGKYAPSSTDSGSTGSLVNDVYWGAQHNTVHMLIGTAGN